MAQHRRSADHAGVADQADNTVVDDPAVPSSVGSPASRIGRLGRKLATIPGAVLALVGTGLVSTAVAFYAPGLFGHFSQPPPPLFLHVQAMPTTPIDLVMDSAATATSPGSGCDTFYQWGHAHGGRDAGKTQLALVVQGQSDSNVFISGIRADIVAKAPLGNGVDVFCEGQGEVTPTQVSIDLDRSASGYTRSGPGAPFGYTVNRTDTVVFDITARAEHFDYRWRLDVQAVVDGKTRTFVVDDAGRPFETTGVPATQAGYSWSSDQWVRSVHGTSKTYRAGTILR